MLAVTAVLFVLTVYGLVKAALAICAHLGVEPMAVLLWLGLAERPSGQPRRARGRLFDLLDPRIYRDSAEMP